MQQILIPAGQFIMGSTPQERDEDLKYSREHYGGGYRERTDSKLMLEGVQKQVTIRSSFYLGVYEVTQAEYASVMGTAVTPSDDRNRLPAANVSWLDAVEFCRRLSARLQERIGGRIYRLPNEAEWEYACRLGSQPSKSRFAGFAESVWYGSNADSKSHPVGTKAPNHWGLYDMQGNVGEWCANRYSADFFNPAATAGTIRPDDVRVVRGGAYTDGSLSCRPVWREDVRCTTKAPNIGFRVAMTPRQ